MISKIYISYKYEGTKLNKECLKNLQIKLLYAYVCMLRTGIADADCGVFCFLFLTDQLFKFFKRNLELRFVRIKPVCEHKHRAEAALELRNSFDFWQNLRGHGF